MKITSLNVVDIYNEADWVKFDNMLNWDYPIMSGYQYDDITDDDITSALNDQLLTNIDPQIDWEDDEYLDETIDIPDELKHSYRVAAIVKDILKSNKINPISIDTAAVHKCCSCITNGHHRIRALQYLKYDGFPAILSGYVTILKKLKPKKLHKQ